MNSHEREREGEKDETENWNVRDGLFDRFGYRERILSPRFLLNLKSEILRAVEKAGITRICVRLRDKRVIYFFLRFDAR